MKILDRIKKHKSKNVSSKATTQKTRYLPVLRKKSDIEKGSSLIIPSYFITKECEKIDVEEELIGFAVKHSGDYVLYRTAKPKMEEKGLTFGNTDRMDIYKKLKTSEIFGDRFVIMLHRHPGEWLEPSMTDKETFSLLRGLYGKICGIILNKNNTRMNVFYVKGFDDLKMIGNGLNRGERDGYWEIKG